MEAAQRPRARILVVDDDDPTTTLLREALSDVGYATASAPDGRAALDVAKRFQPDLILLDLLLPDLDGWAFAERYRGSARRPAPIIVMTALSKPDVSSIAPAALLLKPFDLDDLQHAIQRVLRESLRATAPRTVGVWDDASSGAVGG